MENIIRFSVSLPQNLLEEMDKKVEFQGYASRSEFTRDLIREKIVKDNWENEDGELIGVLTIIYEHHQSDVLSKMMEIEHNAQVEIACTTHIHIDHDNCLETICMKGFAQDIIKFTNDISSLKGVKFSSLAKASVPI